MSAPLARRFARKLLAYEYRSGSHPVPHLPLGCTNALSVSRFTGRWSFLLNIRIGSDGSEEYPLSTFGREGG
jgi:hypothetical protein